MAPRLIYLHQLRTSPLFEILMMDPLYHDQMARLIVGGEFIGKEVFFRAPLYPYFLAFFYKIFGHNLYLVKLVQHILGSLSCVLIYHISKRILPLRTAFAAGLVAALYPIFIYFEGELLIVSVIVFLDLCLIWTLLSASNNPSTLKWLLAGFLLGLSAIARPNILILIPFVVFWTLFLFRRKMEPGRIAISIAVFCVGIAICVMPVLIRNYAVGRDVVPIASQAGINFYIGNNPHSDGMAAIAPGLKKSWWGGYHDAIRIAEQDHGRPLKPSEVSRFWLSKGLQFMKNQPWDSLLLMLKKLHLFWTAYEIPNNQDIYFFGGYSSLFRVLVWKWKFGFPFGILAPLSLAGIFISLRNWRRFLLLYGFIFLYMLSVTVYFVCARYRVPVIPFLIIFASLAVYQWTAWLREGRYRKFALSAGLASVLFALVNVNLYGAGKIDPSLVHFSLGRAYEKKKMYTEATEEYNRALSLNPNYAEAHVNLGVIFKERGQIDLAIKEYREAIRLDPSLPESYNNLGNIYASTGNYEEAETQFKGALSVDSRYFIAYNNLGNLYFTTGNYGKAVKMYSRAIEIDPHYESALFNCGLVYYEMGQFEKAIHFWQSLLRLTPKDRELRRLIGEAKKRLKKTE